MGHSILLGQSTAAMPPYSIAPNFPLYAHFCENTSHPKSFVFEKRQLESYVRQHQRDPVHAQRHALTNFVDILAKLMDEQLLIVMPNPRLRLPRIISDSYITLDAYLHIEVMKGKYVGREVHEALQNHR